MAIRNTVSGLEGQVAPHDVLALEAIRVFLPDVFRLLPSAIDGLTVTTRPLEREIDRMMPQDVADSSSAFNERRKAQVRGLIEAAEKDRKRETARTAKEVVDAMIDCLFPAGARLCRTSNGDSEESHANEGAAEHLAERRVAHEHVLRLYLERVTSPELLAFHDAEQVLARMTDRDRLNEFIRSLEPARWQDVVSNLCDLSDRFRPEHVEPGIAVLLDLWPDMPEHASSSIVLDNDTRGIVRRTTYRLMCILEGDDAVDTVRRILSEVTSLSSKVELALLVGHGEDSGHKLVSEAAAKEFETMLRNEIRAASADDLAEEREPSIVLAFAKQHGGFVRGAIRYRRLAQIDLCSPSLRSLGG